MRFERITVKPAQMGGQPCIRGLRIPVATVVAMVADGPIRPRPVRTSSDDAVIYQLVDSEGRPLYRMLMLPERIKAGAMRPIGSTDRSAVAQ